MMNTARTAALMALLMVLFGFGGYVIGGQGGLVIAFGIAVALNFGSYWFSDKIVLRMYNAQEVDRSQAPELFDMIDRLRQRAQLPMPKVYVIPSEQPNAFATGRNPQNAVVAVTNGIVKRLDRAELEGVIAHELAHIQNRDILTSSIAATLAAAVTMLARFGLFFGGDRDRGGLIGTLLMVFLAPVAAFLIQMAISRAREYVADRDGARICGQPRALASALRRLEAGAERQPMDANPSTSHMFIVQPFSGRMGGLASLFSTHPSTDERVRRLEAMDGKGSSVA